MTLRFGVLPLLLLPSLLGCSIAPPSPASAPSPTQWRVLDSLVGLWSVQDADRRFLGSLRLTRAVAGLQAQFLPGPKTKLSAQRLQLRLAGRELEGRDQGFSLALTPPAAGGFSWPAHKATWRARLVGHIASKRARVTISATRVTYGCPICRTETKGGADYCSSCGMHLVSPGVHDVRLSWSSDAGLVPFKAKELERALAGLTSHTHKVVVTDLRFRRKGGVSIGQIVSWAFLGVFSGFHSWEYTLTGNLRIDQSPPVPFRVPLELNFFERNGGWQLLALSAVSFAYPAPLLSADPELVADRAVKALALRCVKDLDRP